MIQKEIEPTDDPIELKEIRNLIDEHGFKVELLLQYTVHEYEVPSTKRKKTPEIIYEGAFEIFAKYHHHRLVVRQIYTQRNAPRKFKDLERAFSWAKNIGFTCVYLSLDLDTYLLPEAV